MSLKQMKGDKSVTAALLKEGADPCYSIPNIPSPLHLAAMCGNLAIIQILIKNCANLHAQDFAQ